MPLRSTPRLTRSPLRLLCALVGLWALTPADPFEVRPRFQASGTGFRSVGSQLQVEASGGAIRFGAWALQAADGPFRLAPDGSLERNVGEVIESVRMTAGGLSHSFWLPRRPAADVELLVRFEGAQELRADSLGVTLRTKEGSWRYGQATLIDAAGLRTPIALAAEGQTVRLKLSAALMADVRFPAVLDPFVSPIIDVAPSVILAASGEQQLTWNGNGWYQMAARSLIRVALDGGRQLLPASPLPGGTMRLTSLGGEAFVAACDSYAPLCVWSGGWYPLDGGTEPRFSFDASSATSNSPVSVVGSGGQLLFTWVAPRADGGDAFLGRRFTRTGFIDNVPLIFSEPAGPSSVAAATDTSFAVGWLADAGTAQASIQLAAGDGGVALPGGAVPMDDDVLGVDRVLADDPDVVRSGGPDLLDAVVGRQHAGLHLGPIRTIPPGEVAGAGVGIVIRSEPIARTE